MTGYNLPGDTHMHTVFSTDSGASVRSMLDAAVKKGLHAVCITDHMDIDYPPRKEKNPIRRDRFRFSLIWRSISGPFVQ